MPSAARRLVLQADAGMFPAWVGVYTPTLKMPVSLEPALHVRHGGAGGTFQKPLALTNIFFVELDRASFARVRTTNYHEPQCFLGSQFDAYAYDSAGMHRFLRHYIDKSHMSLTL